MTDGAGRHVGLGDHLRNGNARLALLLQEGQVVCHPFVVGELACGQIRNRSQILLLLQDLPMLAVLPLADTLRFIDQYNLMGKGLGFVDAQLLAAVVATGCPLWTLDRRLHAAASKLKRAAVIP